MLHLSLFLFLSGLVIFLFNVNHSVYLSVISWIGFFSTLYGLMTMMRIIRYNSPYYTPLSSMAWLIHNCMQHALGTVLSFTVPRHGSLQTWIRLRFLKRHYDYQVSWGVLKAAEETASVRSLKIDLGIFHWTLGSLSRAGEDDILERFFEAIPGFFNLQMVTDIQRHHFPHMFRSQFVDSLCAFLDRNLLSSTISESTKTRRLVICMNATKGVCDSDDIDRILSHLSSLPFDQVSPSIETARILSHWCNISDRRVSWSTRELVARILLYVQERDDRWIALARDQFDIPEHVLRNSVAYGDDSVCVAGHSDPRDSPSYSHRWNSDILSSVSKFDMRNTHPRLQHEFCALWNEIVRSRSKGQIATLCPCSPVDSPGLPRFTSRHRCCPDILRCFHRGLGRHSVPATVVSVLQHRHSSPISPRNPAHSWR